MRLARLVWVVLIAIGLSGCARRGMLDDRSSRFAATLHKLKPTPLRRTTQAEAGSGEEAVAPPGNDLSYLASRFASARNREEGYRGFVGSDGHPRVCRPADKNALFAPPFMRSLAELGTPRARGANRWRELPQVP